MDLRAVSASVSQAATSLAGLTLRLQARFAALDGQEASAFRTGMRLWFHIPHGPHGSAFPKKFRNNSNTVQQFGGACQRLLTFQTGI